MEYEPDDTEVFPKTIVVKAIGSERQLKAFKRDLGKVYARQNLTFSHLIKNRGNPGFHVFINIILPSDQEES